MADVALQRKNMVESQVRPSDVTDRRILRAMQDVRRELFVPAAMAALAYADSEIRLTPGSATAPSRHLMAPRTLARLLQLARIERTDRMLVVGAGSGYAAAVAHCLAGQVTALESDSALAEAMAKALPAAGAEAVVRVTGPLAGGWPDGAPYDVILIDGAVEAVPDAIVAQLKSGGRLVAVVGRGPAGKATLWRRDGERVGSSPAFDAAAPLLADFAVTPRFRL